MIIDYKDFFRIFLCKDVEDLKARLAFLALQNIRTKEFYEVGDSWIEDEKLQKRVLKKVLHIQQDFLSQYEYLLHSLNQYGDINKDYRQQRIEDGDTVGFRGKWVITCFIDFLQTYKEFERAVDIYENYPDKEDETGKDIMPYSNEYIEKWLKGELVQSKYNRDK
jgi:hypothetical protein